MAQFTIQITDMGPTAIDVSANSNPALPDSALLRSNAQILGMDIIEQLKKASRQLNDSAYHKIQVDALNTELGGQS